MGGMGGFGGLGGLLGAMNGTGSNPNTQNQNQTQPQPQPQTSFGNPFFSMMGSGFGNPQNNQTFPNLFSNTLQNGGIFGAQNTSNTNTSSNLGGLSSMMANLTKVNDEQTYKTQIK
jgi:hypothetical protein